MRGPQTQIVAPGEIVVFNCHARGNTVYWYINGRFGDPQIYNETRGFSITYHEIPRPRNELEEHNNTMIVEARPSNNNTLISCTAAGNIHNQQDHEEGYLIIAGIDACNVTLNWHENDKTSIFVLTLLFAGLINICLPIIVCTQVHLWLQQLT